MKKILNKLFSMKVAIAILILLIIACVCGSVIVQGYSQNYYLNIYSEKTVHLIMALGLNDVFHTWWFIILTIFLCISILGCNLLRYKPIINKMKSYKKENFIKNDLVLNCEYYPEELFEKTGFKKIQKDNNTLYSCKNLIGLWGAWLTHLGILIIIVGFAIGQVTTVKYTVYGCVNDTLQVEDTDLELTINSFDINLREDETVEQYISNITLTDNKTGQSFSGDTSVNHPSTLHGYKVYQNSTGWAARVCFWNGEEVLECTKLCTGEYMTIENLPGLYVLFNAFYPDYVNVDGNPMSQTSKLNNPGYLYTVYYNNNILGMNVLNKDYISLEGPNGEDFRITFQDPEPYSLLQLKKDNSTGIVFVGSILLLIALYIAFYMPTMEMLAEEKDGKWDVYIKSKKGNVLLKDRIILENQNIRGKK